MPSSLNRFKLDNKSSNLHWAEFNVKRVVGGLLSRRLRTPFSPDPACGLLAFRLPVQPLHLVLPTVPAERRFPHPWQLPDRCTFCSQEPGTNIIKRFFAITDGYAHRDLILWFTLVQIMQWTVAFPQRDGKISISTLMQSTLENAAVSVNHPLRLIHTRRSGLRFPQWAASMQR